MFHFEELGAGKITSQGQIMHRITGESTLRKVLHRANIPARRFWILDFGEGRDGSGTDDR
jgi:hypothetical protein